MKARFEVYKEVSLQIRAILAEHTPIIEPLSLDEAYLDVTENLQGIATATEIARLIRAKIRTETGLTASACVSYNKFLAKLASDHRKPDGLFVITPAMGPGASAAAVWPSGVAAALIPCWIASIECDDALILPYRANPTG